MIKQYSVLAEMVIFCYTLHMVEEVRSSFQPITNKTKNIMENTKEMSLKNNIVDLSRETIQSMATSTTDEMPVRPHGNRRCSLPVVWPEGSFTVHEAQSLNPKVINITLRFRLKRALENGSVKLLGKRPVPFGRPRHVFVSRRGSNLAVPNGVQDECPYGVEAVAV